MGDMLVGVVRSSAPCDCGRIVGEGRGDLRPVFDCGLDWEPSEPRFGDCWGGNGFWGRRPGGRGAALGEGGCSDPAGGQDGLMEAVNEAEKDTGVVGRLTLAGEEE